ncbi:MAG TPA: helix-turn-helix transcriptional regulator [Bdellovibrio sp.]|nr:helix-turn-helix transcriptional regulator [Bdellovibrio sp.]
MNTKKIGLAEIQKQHGVLTFARLLKSHRLGEELTQVEMAKKLRLSKQSLNDLEQGRKIPSIRRAVQIARKIGLLEDLLVQLVLQDQIRREKLPLIVTVRKSNTSAA